MSAITQFGNRLYTGETSVNFIGRRVIWYLMSAALIVIAVAITTLRGGFAFGIEFRGGSEFQISNPASTDTAIAEQTITSEVGEAAAPKISIVGGDSVRVQTEQLTAEETDALRVSLADAYSVPVDQVTSSFIGASWGADITTQALRALIIFLVLVSIVMALYFRTWKMSVAAMVAVVHDLTITAAIYGAFGLEVTPAAVIGLLTILGYSLYDTVVVFDKIRENTSIAYDESKRTFAESVNLAVNQTLVRSINTSVVAALPVASILFIGSMLLGAGTLRDIALSLFVGILCGAYSTMFIAAPLYAQLREGESESAKQGRKDRTEIVRNASGAVR
ncbi:MAG: protein translocase subunit SecF [Microbacteriaceae bacterium]|nr:protein translocase subunit SecF [Microbacteriaceae bacterium]